MKVRFQFLAAFIMAGAALPALAQSSEQQLESELNQMDRPSVWRNVPVSGARQQVPPMQPVNTVIQNFLPQSVASGNSQQPNPFNLSPFGMLHYMWDDRTYVSSTNPIDQYEVRDNLQMAQQEAALAEVASKRARYSSDPEYRRDAAAQAKAYADAARMATSRAYSDMGEGSLDAPGVASMVRDQATRAQDYANRAAAMANGGGW